MQVAATELAYRENGGIEVALLWSTETDELLVCVADAASGDSFSLEVDSAGALEAFYHPYACASRLGVSFLAPPPARLYGELPDVTEVAP